jgi:hypothetical protein
MLERLGVLVLLCAGLVGCTAITHYTDPVVLRHAQTGVSVTCGPYLYTPTPGVNRFGQTRAAVLRQIKADCREDFQRQGYVPVRE